MNGWLIFLFLVAVYLGVLALLRRRPGPLPGGFEIAGPLLFWRTQFGKRAIQRVARAERFWNVVADVGVVVTWVMGLAIFALLLFQVSLYFTAPEDVARSATPPEFLIGLPGVNPLIPLWYGLAALIVALVIHEGSHGVMAYVGKMRVKSLGLLFFVVPVGAFVEPDEEDLEKASTRAKNRVFAAGPTSNIVTALIAGMLLTALFTSHLAVANDGEGVGIGNVVDASPASLGGLRAGDILVELNDIRVQNGTHFTEILNGTRANQRVTVDYLRDGALGTTTVTLIDKYDYIATVAPSANNESYRGKGFLGIGQINLGYVDGVTSIFAHPFQSGFPGSFTMGGDSAGSFIFYISYPFVVFVTGVDILADPYRDFVEVSGPLAGLPDPVFFGLATLLYWIVWINIMLGTFNALPAGPLDGGQMFRATLRERLMRRYRVDRDMIHVEKAEVGGLSVRGKDEETQRKLERIQTVTSRATWTLGLFILTLIVLPLFGPRLLGLFVA